MTVETKVRTPFEIYTEQANLLCARRAFFDFYGLTALSRVTEMRLREVVEIGGEFGIHKDVFELIELSSMGEAPDPSQVTERQMAYWHELEKETKALLLKLGMLEELSGGINEFEIYH